ncbi:MAG: CapA family protein [Bacteroidales bacterium]|nr:CapA family protein [Bacteroidales bacterium]
MLKILGDINFSDWYFDQGKGVGSSIVGGADPFHKLPISSEDFWIGNLECVCADIPDKHYPFVISPALLTKIRHMDLYGIANNHIMQAGENAFYQTLTFLDNNGIKYAGADNHRSITFIHQSKKVGFMAFSMRPDNFTPTPSYWHLPELTELKEELKKLEKCDFRIIFVHWGYEFINRPNIDQRQLAHWLIDEGADLIVGMHPHVTQGSEIYKGKNIFYSIGNTVFNMAWEPTRFGLMLNVDLSKDKPTVWSNYIKIGNDFFPEIVTDVPHPYTRDYLDSIATIIDENEKYFAEVSIKTAKYTNANRKAIIKRMLKMSPRTQFTLISDFIKRRLLSR